jgi:hypothetical protein
MSTSGRIYGEFLRLIFFLSNKQADDYFAALRRRVLQLLCLLPWSCREFFFSTV